MRICIDARSLDGRLTGMGKALAYLLRQLRADFPRHEYLTCSSPAAGSWRLPRQFLWEQLELPWRALRSGARVLHVPGGTAAPLLGARRVVMTIHDLAPTRHPELLPHARSRWYWGRWVPLTARFADAILVPSAATKRDLIALAGIPDARITVTPWGVPLEVGEAPAPDVSRAVAARYGLPERFVLYVGAIDRRKDYRTLLEALARLDPDVGLAVAGTVIEGRTDFRETIEAAGLHGRVRVLGYVPDVDLPALYRAASVFVYPTFYEGFGLPVLEAMACGTPVITYNVTSLPEVTGDAARLLDLPVTPAALAGEITRVMQDPDLRRELSARGRERARAFDWATTARLTAGVYEAVAG